MSETHSIFGLSRHKKPPVRALPVPLLFLAATVLALFGCPHAKPKEPKGTPAGVNLAPGFKKGQVLTYKGRLGFKTNVTLMGSAHRQRADLNVEFTLKREVVSAGPQSVRLHDRFVNPRASSPGTEAARLKALSDEFAKMELHWQLHPSGRITYFQGHNFGKILNKLKLVPVFRHLYSLAVRTPGKPVLPGSTWKHEAQTTTPFAGRPVTVVLVTKYQFKGHTKVKGARYAVIHGKERGIIPDTKDSKSAHRFKVGGLIRGRIEVLLDPQRKVWKQWRVGRVMGLAATKRNPKGKEMTYGLRYEMRLELDLVK